MEKMTIKYISSLLFVRDIKASREFYENVLGQKVGLDHGVCVSFSAGFSIMLKNYAYMIIFKERYTAMLSEKHDAGVELYFETDDITEVLDMLRKKDVRFVHDIFEQPWGQRVFRIYDPDMFIVEFGEPMGMVIKRYAEQGMSAEVIADRTSMPLDMVRQEMKQAP